MEATFILAKGMRSFTYHQCYSLTLAKEDLNDKSKLPDTIAILEKCFQEHTRRDLSRSLKFDWNESI